MTERQANPPTPPGPGPAGSASTPDQLAVIEAVEQALQRQTESLLQRAKELALEAVDEVGRKHGSPLLAELRQALAESTAALFRAEMAALADRLRPALYEGGNAVRRDADRLVGELKGSLAEAVTDVFRVQVPGYAQRAGRRVLDYLLASTLLSTGAVLACVGGVLGLEQAGLPEYAAYLSGGGVALAAGAAVLKLHGQGRAPQGGELRDAR
jgi:hypothetical protein